MSKLMQYLSQVSSPLMAALILFLIFPVYGNPAPNNGLVRGLNGILIQSLPSISTDSTSTEDGSNSVSIKSSTFVNEQGAGAEVSAIANSPNGETSQSDVNQFTPGATSISTTVNASTSNAAPPSTQITVKTPAVPVPQTAIAVDGSNALPTVDPAANMPITPAIASPSDTLSSMTQQETAPAIVPVVPPITPAAQSSIIDSSNPASTPLLTQINTPEATFNIVNLSAIVPPATTFIPAFSDTKILQNSTSNINQANTKVVRQQVTAYEVVGMPSRVWPGLGLKQKLRSSN